MADGTTMPGSIRAAATAKKQPHPDDVAIGTRIRLFRRAKGMSQEALAEACGVSFQQIQKYENGTNRVSGSRLVMIAKKLGVTLNEIFGVDEASQTTELLPALKTPGAVELLKAFAEMEPRERAILTGAVTGYREHKARSPNTD